ncbi:MAG: hypothetical protein HYR50_12030 [Candidatus Rokubacteria bacterium]|nr:hypothetical protein [Candidatus Rokubacteria bacterium]
MTEPRPEPFTGVYPIAPTPFTDAGDVDLDGQRRVLDCMIDQGVVLQDRNARHGGETARVDRSRGRRHSVSLVGLYLCIKWLTPRGLEPKQILLFMSGFACLGFLAVAAPSLSAVVRSSQFPGFLAAATFAGVFAAIGHWADFEAISSSRSSPSPCSPPVSTGRRWPAWPSSSRA